ncbi:Stress-associated endoplasmic reticulum protein [Trypanosoma melophagium]|uniref:Stress-associated endoplasmic reticulum protein n=1 Tax=Trypanosoma melophagium TaxID=715481 RepID=UPI00351A28A9|nr:Stress-associated endoplasmic reticulum protein [Trypanosoma melophagium]
MPLSPARTMRVKAQKQNSQISTPRLSDEEKKRLREKKENKSPVPTWLVVLMLFIVFGSSIFLKRTFVGGMAYNVKRPYRIDIRIEHDKKRRVKRRNIGCRRMMKS